MLQLQYVMNKLIWSVKQPKNFYFFFLVNDSSLASLECEGAIVLFDLMFWGGMVNPDEMFKVMI